MIYIKITHSDETTNVDISSINLNWAPIFVCLRGCRFTYSLAVWVASRHAFCRIGCAPHLDMTYSMCLTRSGCFKVKKSSPNWPSVTLMKYYDPPILVLCSFNMGKIQIWEWHKNSKIHQRIFDSEPGTKPILRLLPVLHAWQKCQRISWTLFPGGSILTFFLLNENNQP